MNQKSRLKAKNIVKKELLKFLSNANFEYNFRNNEDNCNFEPVYDKIDKISYLKNTIKFFIKIFMLL